MGKLTIDRMPASITPKATIQAKSGRSMKKREIILIASGRWSGIGRGFSDYLDRRAGLGVLATHNDQPVARLQTVGHPPLISHRPRHGEDARLRASLLIPDHGCGAALLVAVHSLLRREDTVRIYAFDDLRTDIHPR